MTELIRYGIPIVIGITAVIVAVMSIVKILRGDFEINLDDVAKELDKRSKGEKEE